MRFAAFAATLLLVAGLARASAEDLGLTGADRGAIRAVIERQMAAFARDDDASAFACASPAIQRQFGTPEAFMRMVRAGYAAVYRPRAVHFAEARLIDGVVIQPVDVIGPDGSGEHAFYVMEREGDGSWRINGVTLTPSGEKET